MSERILIIEDEAAIQSILAELLTDAGYNIEVAGDGLEGITKFREKPFSLVLLDIMMPKIDGYTVCEIIRQESNVPIIMLTALDEEEAQVRAFELKVDDYITKPFSVKLVLMRVEAVLRRINRREGQEDTNTLSYKNIRLDRESYCVFVSGKAVALTYTEYKLLEQFMLHPGRVFTRDNLLNQVWGYDFVGEEKTVNIHIMNLRRKLDTNMIETIRGVGYRLGKEN
ncbi:response regulator transcription factor [Catenibacillus scindens]|uniref:response regulator transcription factor n=1 Tax=Catenibacillus scindens TaxID=673271 RepID=UPI0032088A7B